MTSPSRLLASVAFACALGCAGAVFSSTTPAAAAEEEGASASAERTIPVAPVDPASTAGRIVLAFVDWLEQRGGSGPEALRLALDAPMRAEEQGGTVTVHLPGARLVRGAKSRPDWTLGDLAIAVTPRSATAYDFETALPPQIDLPGGRLRSSEGTINGTWRSDLEVATRLDVDAATLGFHQRKGPRRRGRRTRSLSRTRWSRTRTGCGTVAPRSVFPASRGTTSRWAGSTSRAASRISIAISSWRCDGISARSRTTRARWRCFRMRWRPSSTPGGGDPRRRSRCRIWQ